jgi:hypothetical protein
MIFHNVDSSVGPITGRYDIILGTPFFSQFQYLSVSIALQTLTCKKMGRLMFNYRHCNAIHSSDYPPVGAVAPVGPREQAPMAKAAAILRDYANLFPSDISAVMDEEELAGHLPTTGFPKTIFRVRPPECNTRLSSLIRMLLLTNDNTCTH